ncbi:P-loop containing nucleoside triphosphate hydrolase protein [Glomus cerebriforme]|uniref:P-loop containing nucleoside triphosphate hydrolase protein n=1 Tax=Glomus cerebriforme TaxID=658196 RepID=A0A397TDE0_9GLOM|nr:P-loop containing nucleoside triphosphate hydrolase protein [Glomus cerebriforme]
MSSRGTNENVQEPDPFKVEHVNGDILVHLINPNLINTLRIYSQSTCLYEQKPKIPAYELFLILPELKKVVENGVNNNDKNLKSLVELIEKEYESKVCEIKEMVDNNVISFKNLFYLFTKGQHVHAVWNECIIGAKITNTAYQRTFCGEYMNINAEIIDSDGNSFIHGIKSFNIREWEGVCEIEKLPVVPLPKESPIRDNLIARGKKFIKYAIGPHYLQYSGNMFRSTWFGITNFKSDGRVMIDAVSFSKINPSYNMGTAKKLNHGSGRSRQIHVQLQQHDEKSVKEEEIFMCVPSLFGFSFTTKKWGQLYVDKSDEITFDDDAFDQLVMDPIKKELISSLVTSKHKGVDLISGKGGGCVFLLHGPPGVGKTLTAEAISEFLHRPLYAVSVGELGTSAVDLENKLSEILEVASIWNAVILIDEADIFLERRSEHDIHRNALVSIFLRLLEYHQGILFLTTNRVKCFDAAFQSRISIALKYNELDADARKQVWRTFLDRIEGKNKSQVDIENLKRRPLNGREIKTAVRLAKALTTKNDPDAMITTQQLETILDISKSFGEELENRDKDENLENENSDKTRKKIRVN